MGRKSKFTKNQMLTVLREMECGRSAESVCAELGVSKITLYLWKRKLHPSEAQQLRNEVARLTAANAALNYTITRLRESSKLYSSTGV